MQNVRMQMRNAPYTNGRVGVTVSQLTLNSSMEVQLSTCLDFILTVYISSWYEYASCISQGQIVYNNLHYKTNILCLLPCVTRPIDSEVKVFVRYNF